MKKNKLIFLFLLNFLGYGLLAKDSNIYMEVTNVVNNYYKESQKAGGGKWDTSSLYKRLKDII